MADYRIYNYDYNYDYIEGNAVRQINPAYQPEVERPVEREMPYVDPEKQARIKRNRARHNVIDFKYMVVIACSLMVVFGACVSFLYTQAQITAQKSNIVAMQSELDQINNENVAKEEQMNSSVDLSAIYACASSKLGMKYADTKHTILYESSDPDYVRQFQDIPSGK